MNCARRVNSRRRARGLSIRPWIEPVFPALLIAICIPPEDAGAGEFSALVMGTSNFFYRGYSKSDNGPTVRANVDYSHDSGFYGGMWVSRVYFEGSHDDPANVELYPYLGYSRGFSDQWRGEIYVSRYIYDGKVYGESIDYNEYSAAVHYRDLVSVRIDFADNAYDQGKTMLNYELSGRYPLTGNLNASMGVGFNQSSTVLEYDWLYWNAGLTWFFRYGALDVRYVDAVESAYTPANDKLDFPYLSQSYVVSITLGF